MQVIQQQRAAFIRKNTSGDGSWEGFSSSGRHGLNLPKGCQKANIPFEALLEGEALLS